MTDIDIDKLLRARLSRAAVPADPSGVADAIRARLNAGDTGTPAPAGATAPGFSRSPFREWLPWMSLIVVGAVVGASLGLSGVVASPWSSTDASGSDSPSVVDLPISSASPVPSAQPTSAPTASESAPPEDPSSSPVASAPPAAPPQAPVSSDTIAPTLSQAWVAPAEAYNGELVSTGVIASDNVSVTGVAVTWSGPTTFGSGVMTSLGQGRWGFEFNPSNVDYGYYTVTMRATDAQGNTSAPVTVQFLHIYFG
jgi:hypothetical protein